MKVSPLHVVRQPSPRFHHSLHSLLTRHSDARRYFKQSEIVLYRQTPEIAAAAAAAAATTTTTGAPAVAGGAGGNTAKMIGGSATQPIEGGGIAHPQQAVSPQDIQQRAHDAGVAAA